MNILKAILNFEDKLRAWVGYKQEEATMVDIYRKDTKYPQCTKEACNFFGDISQRIRDIVEIGCGYGFIEEQIKEMVADEISDRFCGKRLFEAYEKKKAESSDK